MSILENTELRAAFEAQSTEAWAKRREEEAKRNIEMNEAVLKSIKEI